MIAFPDFIREILDYLGDAATTKLVFVVFQAFVGFVHDIALSASVMADEPRPGRGANQIDYC